MIHSSEGIKSKGGIVVGFNLDDEYEDESTSHKADLIEVYARVVKLPERLYFDKYDPRSMPWECDMDLEVGDLVWFNTIESYNAVEIECEGKFYKIIPYQDIYCAKRELDDLTNFFKQVDFNPHAGRKIELSDCVIMLNGYCLLKPIYIHTEHELAVDDTKEDKTRGIVAFIGKPNKQYQNDSYMDFRDLRIGDLVLYNPNTPIFKLERTAYLAQFDDDNLYNVVQRRRIAIVLSKNN